MDREISEMKNVNGTRQFFPGFGVFRGFKK